MDKKDSFIFESSSNLKNQKKNQEMPKMTRQETTKMLKKIKEKLWLFGRHVGKVKGTIEIRDVPQLKQMSLGVLSDKGILFSSLPFFSDYDSGKLFGKHSKKPELVELLKHLKVIKSHD